MPNLLLKNQFRRAVSCFDASTGSIAADCDMLRSWMPVALSTCGVYASVGGKDTKPLPLETCGSSVAVP